jgi:hypothetical protein
MCTLDSHILFSTGWEWGYWLHDVASLRASFELPASPAELIEHAFARDLASAVQPVLQLISLQREYLHRRGLVAYLAGRDAVIDAGRDLDIVSQPDRVTFDDLVATRNTPGFTASVRDPLAVYANGVDDLAREVAALDLPGRWGAELRDGFAIDVLRARFAIALYDATIAHVEGRSPDADLATARTLLARATDVVAARHVDLHDTHRRRLLDRTPNHTFYQFGYLHMADTLCYWRRELAQVEGITGSATGIPPACVFSGG